MELRCRGVHPDDCRICVVTTGPPEPLLEVCAKHAFYEITKPILIKLLKYLKITSVAASARLCEILQVLVTFVLEHKDWFNEEALIAILNKRRMHGEYGKHGVHQYDEALDLLTQDDAREALQESQTELAKEDEMKEFGKDVQVFANKTVYHRRQLGHAKSRTMKGRKAFFAAEVKLHILKQKNLALHVPDKDTITGVQAQRLAPSGAYVYKQAEYARWQLSYDGKTRSRSWNMHGFKKALVVLLKWVWKLHLEKHGFEVIDCPIEGLFPARLGDAAMDQANVLQADVIS